MISAPNFYAEWRARHLATALREGDDTPPERLLQAVWQHQRLLRDQLRTLDGQTVRVLHPGFKNVEAGPDFRGAVIQLGDDPPRSGDVEIDLRSADWHAHGHDRNPNFKKVILHVVWEDGRSLVDPSPTLAASGFLDAPLRELDSWYGGAQGESLPEYLRGRCCAPLRELPPDRVADLLHQAAQVRLCGKAAWFQARARQSGWEQALWEGLFRALGYKQNVWPMQRLAELRPRLLEGERPSPFVLQARLLGVSGLLPAEVLADDGYAVARTGADDYLRRIWELWWRERDKFSDCILPRTVWKYNGLRPANHPRRRLALAAHWLAAEQFVPKLERWCANPEISGESASRSSRELPDSLLKILQIQRDDFWSWHWTLRPPRLVRPQPLLGEARATDLGINVILPWLWARATEGKNESLRQSIEERYFAWPPAEDNALLRLARQRLLSGAPRRALSGAAAQQGLLQIVRDFCDHSNAVCDECRFPDLVRTFKR